jgi:hypothetical protein
VTIQVCGAVTVSFALAAGLARRAWDARTTAGRVAAFATAAAVLAALVWPVHALKTVPLSGPVRSGPDPQRVSGLEAGNARRAAAAYLASVVPPDGRVFVACGRHDKVFTNEPMIYFLADRLPGSRWHCFDPGVITTRPVQEEATRDLARHRVEYVAVSTAFDDVREPNGSAVPDGATVLDEYLRTNYAEDRRFSPVLSVWKRRTPFEAAEGR